MGKDVYIVFVLTGLDASPFIIDSAWWNEKKAKKRSEAINNHSDFGSSVIKKWVNPTIITSPNSYTHQAVNNMFDWEERITKCSIVK